MKIVTAFMALACLAGCAHTTFHELQDNTAGDGTRSYTLTKEDSGLVYYVPVPHLLVTRPQNKDGATTSQIIMLPDLDRPMSMKFHPGLGSAEMGVTLSNGMIASFNQKTDSKIPETLANLAAPFTGLATADATRATASLTSAQEAEIRARIEGLVPAVDPNEMIEPDPCRRPYLVPADLNSGVSGDQAAILIDAASRIACIANKLETAGGEAQMYDRIRRASEQIQFMVSAESESPVNQIALLVILGKDPVADPLRAIVKPFEDPPIPTEGEFGALRQLLVFAVKDVQAVADTIDPPQPVEKPKAFELYRIDTKGVETKLIPVAIP
ncbi:hypothetical protein [Hyphomonas sp.]|uniref:hypothetical protein n=1 Tax=Hyphomonas sp. TaxID=87 RepID=UPI0025BDB5E4|nr:hypothetical protein [Hyphomonas sp.]